MIEKEKTENGVILKPNAKPWLWLICVYAICDTATMIILDCVSGGMPSWSVKVLNALQLIPSLALVALVVFVTVYAWGLSRRWR